MKKKLLTFSIIAFLVCLVVATVFFFLMKKAEPNKEGSDQEDYNVSHIAEKIEFLKAATYDEIKQYADEYPIYIQKSSDENMFAIGELYIEDNPVTLIYQLNDDKSIKRFDGKYSFTLDKSNTDTVKNAISLFNKVVAQYFYVGEFNYCVFDQEGAPIELYEEETDELMLNGKAQYNLSVIDESNTYWNISAVITEKKKMEIDFFRCYDLSVYNDVSPNIDLRMLNETGE